MGSSSKKKAQKAADFKKAKLRVGKTPRKPANFTSTSFKSKAIVLTSQSLHSSAPSTVSQLTHHLSLLSHHSATVRRDSLAHLSSHLPLASSTTTTPSSPLPASTLLPKLAPLVLDQSLAVRTALLTLLTNPGAVPVQAARLLLRTMLLHIHGAMTHIDPQIRGDSTRFLGWALGVSRRGTVGEGGWETGLQALVGVVGVTEPMNSKAMARHIGVLREFLEAGLVMQEGDGDGDEDQEEKEKEKERRRRDGGLGGLHWSAPVHMKVAGVGSYAYLGLFVEGRGEGAGEDVESRIRWCKGEEGARVTGRLRTALVGLVKEGGEVGRAATKALAVLEGAVGRV